jgi:predicted lipoprotein with Yx(FWY)xxD motif
MAQAKRNRPAGRRLSLRGRVAPLGLLGLAVSIVAAACGSSASTQTASGSPTSAQTTTGGPASSVTAPPVVISTSQSATDGTILVSRTTLYTLKPSQTACTAECLKVWPAVLLPKGVTAATAGPGVTASKLGTVAGAGGALQVTYSGQALYWFVGDTAPGQANGNVTDMWGTWSDVPVGLAAASSPATSGAPMPTTPTPTAAPTPAPTTPAAPTRTTPAPTMPAAPARTTPAPTTPPATTTPTTAPASGGAGF